MSLFEPIKNKCLFGHVVDDKLTLFRSFNLQKTAIEFLITEKPTFANKIFEQFKKIKYFDIESKKIIKVYVEKITPEIITKFSFDSFFDPDRFEWDVPLALPPNLFIKSCTKRSSNASLKKNNFTDTIFENLRPLTEQMQKYSKLGDEVVCSKVEVEGRPFDLFVDARKGGFGCLLKFEKEKGSGSCKKVFKAVVLNKRKIVALALTDLRAVCNERGEILAYPMKIAMQEHLIQEQLKRHPKIPGLIKIYYFSYFYFNEIPYQAIVMKYCKDGDLLNQLNNHTFTSSQLVKIVIQLANTINKFHIINFIHRDVKVDNFFIHEGQAYLGDFGFSCSLNHIPSGYCGTPQYLAPELLKPSFDASSPLEYSKASDIYAFGVALWVIFYLRYPPLSEAMDNLDKTEKNKFRNKVKRIYDLHQKQLPLPDPMIEPLKFILLWTTRFNPIERPEASEIVQFFQNKKIKIIEDLSKI